MSDINNNKDDILENTDSVDTTDINFDDIEELSLFDESQVPTTPVAEEVKEEPAPVVEEDNTSDDLSDELSLMDQEYSPENTTPVVEDSPLPVEETTTDDTPDVDLTLESDPIEEMPVTTSAFKENENIEDTTTLEEPILQEPVLQDPVLKEPVLEDANLVDTTSNDSVSEEVAPTVETPISETVVPDTDNTTLPEESVVNEAVTEEPVTESAIPTAEAPIQEDTTPTMDAPIQEDILPTFDTPIAEEVAPSFEAPVADTTTPRFEAPIADTASPSLDSPVTDSLTEALDTPLVAPTTETATPNGQKAKVKKEKIKKEKPAKATNGKKSKVGIIIAAVLGVLILLGGGVYYLGWVNPVTSNTIMSTILKPAKYYQMVEGLNAKSAFADMDDSDLIKTITANLNKSDSFNSDVTLSLSNNLTSLLATSLGNYGSLATSVKSLNFKTDYLKTAKGSQVRNGFTIEIGLNDNSIITANVVVDAETKAIYIQCPTVFKRWIKVEVSEDVIKALCSEKGKEMTPEDIQTIFKTYFYILTENFDDLKLNKKSNITVNDTKVDVREFTVTIDEANLNKIKQKLADTLKKDDLVYSYVESYKIVSSKKEYTEYIDELFGFSKKESKSTTEEILEGNKKTTDEVDEKAEKEAQYPIVMKLYVDNKGIIVGRDFVIGKKQETVIGYAYYDTGDVAKYEFKYTANGDKFNVTGNIVDKNKTYSGTAKITTDFAGTISSIKDLTSLYGSKYFGVQNEVEANATIQDTTKSISADTDANTDTTQSDKATDKTESSVMNFELKYDNIKFVNPEKGLFQGTFTLTPNGIKNLTGSSISQEYKQVAGAQACTTKINVVNQEMIAIASTQSSSKNKTVEMPDASISYKVFTTDVTAQYNALLEIDLFTPAKATMVAMNNPIFNQMVKMYFVKPGLNKLNGSQTAKELKYVATLNPTIKPIFIYGYKLTAAGKNPGLDSLAK